jgi:hypothetical protein
VTRKLTIDDNDIQPLPREALGDERSGNPAADNQRIAFDVLSEVETGSMPACRKPGRAAAAQVGLFGIVCVKNADNNLKQWAVVWTRRLAPDRFNQNNEVWFRTGRFRATTAINFR